MASQPQMQIAAPQPPSPSTPSSSGHPTGYPASLSRTQQPHQRQHQHQQENHRAPTTLAGGRGRGGRTTPSRGHGGRGTPGCRTPSGRVVGNAGGPVISIAPTTGIPFGHVPAYLPGSSSLVEELEARVLIVLRDGRHLVGTLRSFDQYSNMILDDASERKIHCNKEGVTCFADLPLGLYVVRGDSMVLLGQVGPDNGMKQIELEELEEMIASEKEEEGLEWDFDKDLLA